MRIREYLSGGREAALAFGSLCVIVSAASCVSSTQSEKAPSLTEREAVEKAVAGVVEAANAGDLEKVMSCFADDAVAMPPEEMPVFGTRLIRPRLQPLFDQSKLVIFLTSEETGVSGTYAFARGYIGGKIEPRSAAPDRFIDQNEYLMLLEKDTSGSWKIARLMWHAMHSTKPSVAY